MSNDVVLQAFLDKHVSLLEPLARDAHLAYWEMQTTGSAEATQRAEQRFAALAKLYANPEEYVFLKSLPAESLHDPQLARQHALLCNDYLARQMDEGVLEEIIRLETEIESAFNTHRAALDGKPVTDNEIDALLLTSDDAPLRQRAWEASKAIGAVVAEKVLTLARMRNREAQRLGFANFYAMSLALQEVNEDDLFRLLDDLAQESEPLWREYKTALDVRLAERFQITPEEVRPWHHANRFFQAAESGEADLDRFFTDKNLEELTARFFAAIGLPIEDLLAKADLYEREGKDQHAFCTDIDRKGDVRVLCNVRPTARWMGTMLHEFGHAVYDKFHDAHLPYLLRSPAHTMTTEAIALFMGRLDKDARWLRLYAGVDPEEARRIAEAARREVRDHLLVFMRWCLVMAHFERALYRNPDQDLDSLWWDLVAKYQNVALPVEARPVHAWASKIHLASAPVYYHNYQLGEMVASQLLHHLTEVTLAGEEEDALVTSPKVGAFMREKLFLPGALRPWNQWLEHATGEPLNPAYFARQLQGE